MWWYTPVIPVLGRLRQEDLLELEANTGYIVVHASLRRDTVSKEGNGNLGDSSGVKAQAGEGEFSPSNQVPRPHGVACTNRSPGEAKTRSLELAG